MWSNSRWVVPVLAASGTPTGVGPHRHAMVASPHPGKQPSVEASVASAERAITRVNIEIHDASLLSSPGMSSGVSDINSRPADPAPHASPVGETRDCLSQSSQQRTCADHDRTRRSLDTWRQNAGQRRLRSVLLPCQQLARLRGCVGTTRLPHGPCWPRRVSTEPIWMTWTRA
jgi:hypothetical protein